MVSYFAIKHHRENREGLLKVKMISALVRLLQSLVANKHEFESFIVIGEQADGS